MSTGSIAANRAELRARLVGEVPADRLDAAWQLASGYATGAFATAWEVVGGMPSVALRRLAPMALATSGDPGRFAALAVLAELEPDIMARAGAGQMLTRLAEPSDAASYAVVERAAHDTAPEVRAAVVAAIRADAPAELLRAVRRGMRDPSEAVQHAAIEHAFAASTDAGAFLRAMKDASSAQVEHALALVEDRDADVAWADVQRFADRHLPVLVRLAWLFGDRVEVPPRWFWLRCAGHLRELSRCTDGTLALIIRGTVAACSTPTAGSRSSDERALLERALTVLADVLPETDHASYMELRLAGLLDAPLATPAQPLQRDLARLWSALIRLAPDPSWYVLRPRRK